jgi:hypothetical protein
MKARQKRRNKIIPLARKLAALPLISLLSCGNPADPAQLPPREATITDTCQCECQPCEQAETRELSLSEKLDLVSGKARAFKGTTFAEHIRFLDNSRFDDGQDMFPGIAKALRECPYYETNGQRTKIAAFLINEFRENPQENSALFQMMEKLPMAVTALVASAELEIGDPFRMRFRKQFRSKTSNSEKLHGCASFLVQLGNALEKGDGVDAPLEITSEDWNLLDRDLTARLIHWPVKRWWVDELQVWDVTFPDQLARYVCARMRTNFHNKISGFGKRCPPHLREFTKGKRGYDFDHVCRALGVDCPAEPLSYLE